ncbi:zf-PARP-domain-containing protein, partial [Parathielavia appendiculata]
EISPSNRAACQVKACRDAGEKIKKGELRLGVWVQYRNDPEKAGWQWRHWYV